VQVEEVSAVVIVEEDLVAVVVQESVTIFKREGVPGVIAAGTPTRAMEAAAAEAGGVSADPVHAMTSRKDSVQEAIPADSLMMAKEAEAEAVAEEEAALVVQALATTFRKANARAEIDVDSLTMTMEVVVVEEVDLEFVMTFKRVLALEATAVDIAMMKKVVAVEAAEAVGMEEEVMTEEGEETGMTEMTAGIAGWVPERSVERRREDPALAPGGDEVEAGTEEGHGVLTGDGLAVMVGGDPAVDQDRGVGDGDENYQRSSEIDSHRQGQEAGDVVAGVIGHEVETAPGSGQEDDVGSGRGTGKETEGHQQLIRKPQTHQSLTIRKH